MSQPDASHPMGMGGSSASTLTLPAPAPMLGAERDRTRSAGPVTRLKMTPLLVVTVLSAAMALSLAGWQITRAMAGEQRLALVTVVEIVAGLAAVSGLLAWTWVAVENSRRLIAAGLTNDLPSPQAAVASWAMPIVVAVASVASVAFLERRLNPPDADSTSPIPLAMACVSLIVSMCVAYRPLFLLSATIRRIGGGAGDLARWVWVPIALVIVGALTLFGLRAGGTYGDDFEGVAPAWALGVVFVPPVVIILALGWRGGRLVEDAIVMAFDRRNGVRFAGVGRRDLGMFARALRADARPPIARDVRARIRLVPGASIVRLAMTISAAALTLISIVGALVMFLFWREAGDGALLPAQRERAWNALTGLQDLEKMFAVGALGVVVIWAFVSVLNARLATGRRRNPLLAAAAWPAAAYAMWEISQRYSDTEEISPLVTRFALQAAVLYVPFFLLERTAVAVGARRGPLRLSYGMSLVLLVHIQGLGGLATLVVENDTERYGRIAGYLALAALLELVATVSVTEVSRLIGDASAVAAEKHNFLAEQRMQIDARAAATATSSPTRRSTQDAPIRVSATVQAPARVEATAQAEAQPQPVDTTPAPTSEPLARSVSAPAALPEPGPDPVATPAPIATPAPTPPPVPTGVPAPAASEPARPEPPDGLGGEFDPSQPLSSIPPLVYRPATAPTPTTIAALTPPEPPPTRPAES